MTLDVVWSTAFARDYKRLQKQGAPLRQLETVVETLADQQPLAPRHRDHPLKGNWRGYRECHIQPDWLLIYRVVGDELQLARTGSHAELFG
ncbi:MAG: type II toxin-antitoxin system YafQ family toxin [Caldilinea sp. CFX5]|nr:type II toxin-antitoxin system YafQ family toxin [Caldilinea sp. CFX5]